MFELIFIALLGAVIGSFLTVCIYRIPYSRLEGCVEDGETEVEEEPGFEGLPDLPKPLPIQGGELSFLFPPRSICPKCQGTLSWKHNIPILSYVLLLGKCGLCKAPIPFRYPLVEILSLIAAVASYATFGLTLTALIVYAICAMLIVMSYIDIDYFIIPNVITYPATAIGLVFTVINELYPETFAWPITSGLLDTGLGLLVGPGFLWLVSVTYLKIRGRAGMGMGDVKLLAAVGALLGANGAIATMFIGSLAGTVIGGTLILLKGRSFAQHLPFGPYLALGTLTYIFFTGHAW